MYRGLAYYRGVVIIGGLDRESKLQAVCSLSEPAMRSYSEYIPI